MLDSFHRSIIVACMRRVGIFVFWLLILSANAFAAIRYPITIITSGPASTNYVDSLNFGSTTVTVSNYASGARVLTFTTLAIGSGGGLTTNQSVSLTDSNIATRGFTDGTNDIFSGVTITNPTFTGSIALTNGLGNSGSGTTNLATVLATGPTPGNAAGQSITNAGTVSASHGSFSSLTNFTGGAIVMDEGLDFDGQKHIIGLPAPTDDTSPVRRGDLITTNNAIYSANNATSVLDRAYALAQAQSANATNVSAGNGFTNGAALFFAPDAGAQSNQLLIGRDAAGLGANYPLTIVSGTNSLNGELLFVRKNAITGKTNVVSLAWDTVDLTNASFGIAVKTWNGSSWDTADKIFFYADGPFNGLTTYGNRLTPLASHTFAAVSNGLPTVQIQQYTAQGSNDALDVRGVERAYVSARIAGVRTIQDPLFTGLRTRWDMQTVRTPASGISYTNTVVSFRDAFNPDADSNNTVFAFMRDTGLVGAFWSPYWGSLIIGTNENIATAYGLAVISGTGNQYALVRSAAGAICGLTLASGASQNWQLFHDGAGSYGGAANDFVIRDGDDGQVPFRINKTTGLVSLLNTVAVTGVQFGDATVQTTAAAGITNNNTASFNQLGPFGISNMFKVYSTGLLTNTTGISLTSTPSCSNTIFFLDTSLGSFTGTLTGNGAPQIPKGWIGWLCLTNSTGGTNLFTLRASSSGSFTTSRGRVSSMVLTNRGEWVIVRATEDSIRSYDVLASSDALTIGGLPVGAAISNNLSILAPGDGQVITTNGVTNIISRIAMTTTITNIVPSSLYTNPSRASFIFRASATAVVAGTATLGFTNLTTGESFSNGIAGVAATEFLALPVMIESNDVIRVTTNYSGVGASMTYDTTIRKGF